MFLKNFFPPRFPKALAKSSETVYKDSKNKWISGGRGSLTFNLFCGQLCELRFVPWVAAFCVPRSAVFCVPRLWRGLLFHSDPGWGRGSRFFFADPGLGGIPDFLQIPVGVELTFFCGYRLGQDPRFFLQIPVGAGFPLWVS